MSEHDIDYTESFTRTLIITMIIMVVSIFATRQIGLMYNNKTIKTIPTVNAEIKANE